MDLRKYEIFILTAETKNISKAAELTGYSQSGISHMLKSLEAELDLPLITRNKYGVHLTPIGREFLPYARNVVNENKNLEQFICAVHGFERGTLTIGTFSSVSIHWLPPILDGFQKAHPGINIRLKEGGIYEIEQWISNGEVDLAFYSKQPGHTFEFIHLMDDPLVAVLPSDYPLPRKKKSFSLQDFQDKPFILSEIGVDYDINRILKNQDIHPDIRFSAKDDLAIVAMVSHHLGIAILPQLILQDDRNGILTLPLDPACSRDLGIGLSDSSIASPVTKKFIGFVKDYFSRL